jgi:hypothetical protein
MTRSPAAPIPARAQSTGEHEVDCPGPRGTSLRRELRSHARLAVAVADLDFSEALEARLRVESPVIRSNAGWILDALSGHQASRTSRIASARFKRPS